MTAEVTTTLSREIDAQVARFTHRRRRDKRKAFALKLGAAALGALVTILLGVRTAGTTEVLLKNTALVASALVTVLNAWDAFYDHRALWVKRTQTASRLQRLQRSFRLAYARSEGALDGPSVDEFASQLDQIIDDDLASWIQMRTDKPPRKSDGQPEGM